MDMSVDRELVRRLRLSKSWSQEKLAEEAGVSLPTIQRIEADGGSAPHSFRALGEAVGVVTPQLRPGRARCNYQTMGSIAAPIF